MSNPFTISEIWEAWSYAEIAYREQVELSSLFGDTITIFDHGIAGVGDAAYVVDEGDRAVVMFPGSNDVKDWILNLKFDEEDGLHSGFLHDLDRIGYDIVSQIHTLGATRVLVTGHSRGGALADVFLERYGHLTDCPVDCVTFAQPRVATRQYYESSAAGKDQSGIRYLRVYTANDAVPHLPPSRFGYVHRGAELELGQPLSWWQKAIRLARLITNGKKVSLTAWQDHIPETYARHIRHLK